jgi:hypothetical protein
VTTGEIVAVGAAVTVLGGGVLFILHRQNQAALQTAASASAAAARAAKDVKSGNDFDLGRALVDLGGLALDKALAYALGGAKGANDSEARGSALQV